MPLSELLRVVAHLQRALFPEHFCPWSFFFSFPSSSCSLCRVTGSLARQCRSLLKSQTFLVVEKGRLDFGSQDHTSRTPGAPVCAGGLLFSPLQHHRQLQARGATVRGSNFRQQHSPPPLRHPAPLQRTDASVSFVKPAAKKRGTCFGSTPPSLHTAALDCERPRAGKRCLRFIYLGRLRLEFWSTSTS